MVKSNLILRVADASDIPEIVRVINAAYRVEDFFVRGNRTDENDIRARMAAGNSFLVIEEGETLVGAVAVDIANGRGHFAMLSVDPHHQGRGIGRELIHRTHAAAGTQTPPKPASTQKRSRVS